MNFVYVKETDIPEVYYPTYVSYDVDHVTLSFFLPVFPGEEVAEGVVDFSSFEPFLKQKAQTDWIFDKENLSTVLIGLPADPKRQHIYMGKMSFKPDSKFIGQNEYVDHSLIDFCVGPQAKPFVVRNRFPDTMFSKVGRGSRYIKDQGVNVYASLCVPKATPTVNGDMTLILHTGANPPMGIDGLFQTVEPRKDGQPVWVDKMFSVKCSVENPEVESGGKLDLRFTLTRSDGTAYSADMDLFVDVDAGYVPRKRIKFVKGVGTTTIRALDLEPGDKINVKVSGVVFTNIGKVTVEVV